MGGRGGGKEKRRKDELSIEKYREFSMFYDKNYILIFLKKKTPIFSTDKLMIKIQKNEMPIIPLFYYSEWAVIGWEK